MALGHGIKLTILAASGFAAAAYFAYLAAAWPRGGSGDGTGSLGQARARIAAAAHCAQYLGTSEFTYEHCVIGQASERRSQAVCSLLAHVYNAEYYVPSCLTAVAVATGNVGMCPGAAGSGERSACVTAVAGATRRFELCSFLVGESKQACYLAVSIASGDAESCDRYSADLGSERLYCAVRLGVQLEDAAACATLGSQFERDHCFYLSAKALKQPALCAEIKNVYSAPVAGPCGEGACFSSADCYVELAALTGNGDLCPSSVGGPGSLQSELDDCLVGVASSTGQAKWCEHLPSGDEWQLKYHRDRCFAAAAQTSGDLGLCGKVVDIGRQTDCWRSVPSSRTNPEDCGAAPVGFARAYCYAVVAVEHGQPQLCDQLPPTGADGVDWISSCRAWVANPGSIDR